MRRELLHDCFSAESCRLKLTTSGTCFPSTSTMRSTWPFRSSRPRYSLGAMTCSLRILPGTASALALTIADLLPGCSGGTIITLRGRPEYPIRGDSARRIAGVASPSQLATRRHRPMGDTEHHILGWQRLNPGLESGPRTYTGHEPIS